jgi:hypothetical protein
MMLDCPVVRDGPMGLAPKAGIIGMFRANTIDCLQMVGTMVTEEVQYSEEGKELTRQISVFHACETGDTIIDDVTGDEFEIKYCSDHTGFQNPDDTEDGPMKDEVASMYSKTGTFYPCVGGDNPGQLYAFYYDARRCRDFAGAFGAALAYTAYIETCVTIVIIVVFQAMGITMSLDKKKSLMQIANNEDNEDFKEELVTRGQVQKMIEEALANKALSVVP